MEKPLNIHILQAKAEISQIARSIAKKHGLPGVVLDLILSEILADERQAHLALVAEQIDQIKEEKNADTRSE